MTIKIYNPPLLHRLRPYRWLGAIALGMAAATAAYADADGPIPPRSERAPEVRLQGKTVTLPIVMVREFPFIEGAVAGVTGKFMLDTGAEQALSINDHRVPVTDGRTIGQGFFGSGQTFAVRLAPELRDLRVGPLTYPRVTNVQTQDARMLEGITPDFIGWIGYYAFANHALKLDYRNLRATFYEYGGADYLKGERVVAELPFETRKLPNHPIMPARIGDMNVIATWDTGQQGSLYTTPEGKAHMLQQGQLKPSRAKPDLFDLHGVQLNGHLMPVIRDIDVETEASPSAAPLGITEPTELTIGYSLLHQFKTVWDYKTKRIYLMKR